MTKAEANIPEEAYFKGHKDGYEQAKKDIVPPVQALIDAIEQYVEPKPGTPYMHRTKLLNIKNKVKELL